MSTFLAYTSPAAGHLFPLVPGLLALQDRGHEVHVRTAAELVDGARAAGLRHVEALDPRISDVEVRDYEARSGKERLVVGFENLLGRGPAEADDLRRAVAASEPDAVLVDSNAYGAAVAVQAAGLRWASTIPSLLPFPGAGIPPYGLGLAPARGPLARVRDGVLWALVERMYGKAMLPGLNALRAAEGLAPISSPLDHVLAPDRILVLTGEPLEYPRSDAPASVRFVGAQSWDPPAATPAWLEEPGDPWVLVTCSTEYQGDEALAAAAIEALRDEPVRVVVTLADAHGVELPGAPNARVERFLAHGPVLERAVAVVCHGGMGIVQKSVARGVPVVAVPFGRDQPEVARRLVEAGAGVKLSAKRLTPDRLRAAVREAIVKRPAAEAAAARLREAGGPAAFARAAEELVARPGSCAGLAVAQAASSPVWLCWFAGPTPATTVAGRAPASGGMPTT
jgi:MGT family glycosyltransferase